MPPKELSAPQKSLSALLSSTYAVPQAKADDLAGHPKQSVWAQDLLAALPSTDDAPAWDDSKGKLFAGLVSGSAKLDGEQRAKVASWIGEGKLDRSDKVTGASCRLVWFEWGRGYPSRPKLRL